MRNKILLITVSLALFFLVLPHTAQAQKDGEAQAIVYDENNLPNLKFTNKAADKQNCGLFVGYTLMENDEEAFVAQVGHLHFSYLKGPTLPENGLIFITPTRIIFRVENGDKAHAFDLPRTALKNKPASREFILGYPALQINLKEKLPASDSDEQKFGFFVIGDKQCHLESSEPYSKFLERAVKDFDGAMAEFKQVTASLKQAGKIHRTPASVTQLSNPDNLVTDISSDATLPGFQAASPAPSQGSSGNASVDITSEPAEAEIYVDGKLNGNTPSKILLSAGEHTIKVTRPGYKDWEQKMIVQQGSVKTVNVMLEKQ